MTNFHRVYQFQFSPPKKETINTNTNSNTNNKNNNEYAEEHKNNKRDFYIQPKKILLSPNKKFLLIHGAYYNNQKSILVYQIFEDLSLNVISFNLIYYDYSFTFVDACFSPDSECLVAIPSKFSSYLFIFKMPVIKCQFEENPTGLIKTDYLQKEEKKKSGYDIIKHHLKSSNKKVSFAPRRTFPFYVAGPCVDLSGNQVSISNISSNYYHSGKVFHYVTWSSEDTFGQYCLWTFSFSPSNDVSYKDDFVYNSTEIDDEVPTNISFKVYPKTLHPDVTDFKWLEVNFFIIFFYFYFCLYFLFLLLFFLFIFFFIFYFLLILFLFYFYFIIFLFILFKRKKLRLKPPFLKLVSQTLRTTKFCLLFLTKIMEIVIRTDLGCKLHKYILKILKQKKRKNQRKK